MTASKGWDAFVYRTDEGEERYVGFFHNESDAKAWIKGQKEGTYEVTDRKPERRVRVPAEEADNATTATDARQSNEDDES